MLKNLLNQIQDWYWPIFSWEIWNRAQFVVCCLAGFILLFYSTKQLLHGTKATWLPWVLVGIVTLYIGLRAEIYYIDTNLYTGLYYAYLGNRMKIPTWPEIFFYKTVAFFVYYKAPCVFWLLWVGICYVVPLGVASYKMLPRHFLFTLLLVFSAFSFFSYGVNGIRNGMASSLVILGLSFFYKGRTQWIWAWVFIACGVLSHTSMALTAVCALVALRWHNVKWSIGIWIACAVIAFIVPDAVKDFVAGLSDDQRLQRYVSGDVDATMFSRTGYRWDFILYSAVPILFGWFAVVRRKYKDKFFVMLLNVYIYSNAFWVLINSVAYSNRFAYVSWCLYPFILAFVLFKVPIMRNQGLLAGIVMIGFSLFTLMMGR